MPSTIGNMFQRDFLGIWQKSPTELLEKLRVHPRVLNGKCADCKYLNICNGGSRSRAYAIYGDMWGEDPSCYLTKEEIEA